MPCKPCSCILYIGNRNFEQSTKHCSSSAQVTLAAYNPMHENQWSMIGSKSVCSGNVSLLKGYYQKPKFCLIVNINVLLRC